MAQYDLKNCPARVRDQLRTLSSRILQLYSGKVIGIYLHGSLSMECFNPQRSDLDLLVVTHSPTPYELKTSLASLLLELSSQPAPIEIHFLQQSHIQPWQYPTPYDFHFSEAWRERFLVELQNREGWRICADPGQVDEDLGAHIMVTRRRGLCLFGASIPSVFPEVPAKDYIDSILGDVLSDEYGLNSAFTHPATIILNACRTLAYLKTGEVLSKDEGGDWALWNLPDEYHAVVLKALCTYRFNSGDYSYPKEVLYQFAEYMRGQLAPRGHLRPLGEHPTLEPIYPEGSPSG